MIYTLYSNDKKNGLELKKKALWALTDFLIGYIAPLFENK